MFCCIPGSPIIRLNILGQNYVIVNTYCAMIDLLEKKSAIYSDRYEGTLLETVRRLMFRPLYSVRGSLCSTSCESFARVSRCWLHPPSRCGFSWSIAHVRYGQEWRIRRKLFHSQFNLQVSKRYRSIEEKATHQFLGRLLDTPEHFMSHVRLWVPFYLPRSFSDSKLAWRAL